MEVIESSNFKCLFGNDSMPTLPKIGGILRELVLGGSKGVTVRWTLWVRVSVGCIRCPRRPRPRNRHPPTADQVAYTLTMAGCKRNTRR